MKLSPFCSGYFCCISCIPASFLQFLQIPRPAQAAWASSAVLIIKDNAVKLVNIKNQDAVTKVLDMIPDLVDRFTKPKKKEEEPGEDGISDAEVVDIAFPEEGGPED